MNILDELGGTLALGGNIRIMAVRALVTEAFGFGMPMLIRLLSLVVSFAVILVFVREAK